MICVPVVDSEGKVLGVVQAINKVGGGKEDGKRRRKGERGVRMRN